jgi:hypothetical protein
MQMRISIFWGTAALMLIAAMVFSGCAEEGKSGTAPLDCGSLGSAHDGHCHCNEGALFNGETCVSADQITALCVDDHDDADHDDADHVSEAACRCPASGDCPCDHGAVEQVGAASYCVPELHD